MSLYITNNSLYICNHMYLSGNISQNKLVTRDGHLPCIVTDIQVNGMSRYNNQKVMILVENRFLNRYVLRGCVSEWMGD